MPWLRPWRARDAMDEDEADAASGGSGESTQPTLEELFKGRCALRYVNRLNAAGVTSTSFELYGGLRARDDARCLLLRIRLKGSDECLSFELDHHRIARVIKPPRKVGDPLPAAGDGGRPEAPYMTLVLTSGVHLSLYSLSFPDRSSAVSYLHDSYDKMSTFLSSATACTPPLESSTPDTADWEKEMTDPRWESFMRACERLRGVDVSVTG
ncbi:hypothetical protein HK101_007099, partial [Irineochytrium annulatum]